MAETKVCSKCGELKPLSAFNKNKTSNDGHRSQCRECQRAIRLENRDYYMEKSAEYREKAYRKTDRGKEVRAKINSRRRGYGCEPLNDWFEGSHFHHLHINNSNEGIYIPADIHNSIYHNSTTGEGMLAMNIIALLYLRGDNYAAE
jgi:hypothetical protein